MFRDTPPTPPLLLKRPDVGKDYDDTFLPPQNPTVEALKTDFDRPLKKLIDKANNIIEMVPKMKNKTLISMIFTYQISFQSSFQR